MAATKAATTLQTSISNGAGSTTTSASLNLTTAYAGLILAKITNGATGPTVACTAAVNISSDGTTWKQYSQQTGGTTNAGVYPMAFEIPLAAMYAQVVFSGNTGQAVTVEAYAEYVTGI